MKISPLITGLLVGLALLAMYLLYTGTRQQNAVSMYNTTLDRLPQQPVRVTLTEGSLLALAGSKGTQYCPWYVQRNAMLNLSGLKDLTISDGKTVLQIDGRNIVQKNLVVLDDPNVNTRQDMLNALLETRCAQPLIVSNAKLHPLWGK